MKKNNYFSKKTIVIIGSGLSGSLVANELSDSFEVILLDKGPFIGFEYPENYNANLSDVPTFCLGAGGTTNLWHNGLIDFDRESILDQDTKKLLERTGRFLTESSRKLGYNEQFSIREGKNSTLDKLSAIDISKDCIYYPFSRNVIRPNQNIKFYANVTDLKLHKENGLVSHVSFNSSSLYHKISVDHVVVAAGGLQSEILLNDFLDIPNSKTSFIDHPMGFVGKIRVKKRFEDVFFMMCNNVGEYGYFKSGFVVKNKGYSSIFYIGPALTLKNKLDVYKFKSKLGASSGFKKILGLFSKKIFNLDILYTIFNHFIKIGLCKNTYVIMAVFEQKDYSNISSKDEASLNISKDELSIYNEHIRKLTDDLSPYILDYQINSEIDRQWLWSAAHYSGSYSNYLSRVNDNLSLKELPNLYIASSILFNEHSYVNTGLELGALSLYLANCLKNND